MLLANKINLPEYSLLLSLKQFSLHLCSLLYLYLFFVSIVILPLGSSASNIIINAINKEDLEAIELQYNMCNDILDKSIYSKPNFFVRFLSLFWSSGPDFLNPLLFAIESRKNNAALKLLQLGTNVGDDSFCNQMGMDALQCAIQYGADYAVIKAILSCDVNLSRTNYADVDTISLLLRKENLYLLRKLKFNISQFHPNVQIQIAEAFFKKKSFYAKCVEMLDKTDLALKKINTLFQGDIEFIKYLLKKGKSNLYNEIISMRMILRSKGMIDLAHGLLSLSSSNKQAKRATNLIEKVISHGIKSDDFKSFISYLVCALKTNKACLIAQDYIQLLCKDSVESIISKLSKLSCSDGDILKISSIMRELYMIENYRKVLTSDDMDKLYSMIFEYNKFLPDDNPFKIHYASPLYIRVLVNKVLYLY